MRFPAVRFVALLSSIGLMAAQLGAAQAGDRLKLGVEASQSVLSADKPSKTYLRVKLEGLPYESEASRPPVNISLVIDKSGSMAGQKIEQAKEAAILALSRLSPQDRVSVITFDHRVEVVVPAGPFVDFDEMRRRIQAIRPGGQTAIYAAVRQAAQSVSQAGSEGYSRIILMSDGQANIGPSSPAELEKLGREVGGQGISVTTIGLGLDYSEELMTRLALASDGNHAFVENPEQLAGIFNKEFGDALSVVGQDVDIDIDCPEGVTPLRAPGRDVKINGRHVSFRLNQIGGKQERYLILELDVAQNRASGSAPLADVQVSYVDPKTKSRSKLAGSAAVSFSSSQADVDGSVNADVRSAVVTQLAVESSEKAVALRDAGKAEDAKRELQRNRDYLRQEADRLAPAAPASAAKLRTLSQQNEANSAAISGDAEAWNSKRKAMKEEQFKDKTQQKY